jgi:hypothetical protein
MTCARSAIAPPDQHGCFHVVTRCVRQSFLCGVDAASGRSFEHRRDWVEERIRPPGSSGYYPCVSSVRVLAFSAMPSGVR